MQHSATPRTEDMPAATRRKLSELFTPEQIAWLTQRSDVRGAWAIASTWGIIAVAFTVMALWPDMITFLLASALIAGRQLCLAILQHEGSHGTLFKNRWANDVLTDWLCARPIWQNLPKYKVHHLGHHTRTGTDDDPDITLHADYPVTRASLARKMLRDISGLTGLKIAFGLVMMDAGVFKWTVANHIERLPQQGRRPTEVAMTTLRNMGPLLITNGVLLGVLAAVGQAWLYTAWLVAFFCWLPLFVRIRSIAEHGCLPRSRDMFTNTRTTHAGWLARMTVAPVHVNHHLEHHVMASVPYYRLPQMHRWLRDKHAAPVAPSYLQVLKLASSGRRGAAA